MIIKRILKPGIGTRPELRDKWRCSAPVLLVFMVLLPLAALASPAKRQYNEYELKAMILENIAEPFVWPTGVRLSDSAEPFVIAVIGKNPFGRYLDKTFSHKQKRIKKKPVEIRYINEVEEIPGCHLLFIGELSRKKLLKIIEFTGENPILTTGDTHGYEKRGVHVKFYVGEKEKTDERGRKKKIVGILMDINQTALRQAGLSVDKDFLKNDNVTVINPYNPYKEKALQLEKLSRFFQWPEKSGLKNSAAYFNIGVLGKNPFGTHLNDIYRRKRLKNRRVRIREISQVREIAGTHLLFIAASEKNNISQILNYTEDKPILTVGDTGGFARKGVHINFYYEGVKLRVEINRSALRKSGLTIAEDLLKNSRLIGSSARSPRPVQ